MIVKNVMMHIFIRLYINGLLKNSLICAKTNWFVDNNHGLYLLTNQELLRNKHFL